MDGVGKLTGVVGRLEWGWHPAASINGYTITRTKKTKAWALRATVVHVDAFNITQRPLVFIAPHQRGAWRWVVRRVRFPDGDYPPARVPFVVTAELDPPDFNPEGPIYVVPVRGAGSDAAVVVDR
jgi:hypothetical protein